MIGNYPFEYFSKRGSKRDGPEIGMRILGSWLRDRCDVRAFPLGWSEAPLKAAFKKMRKDLSKVKVSFFKEFRADLIWSWSAAFKSLNCFGYVGVIEELRGIARNIY